MTEPSITAETLREAEKLAGLAFDDGERELMLHDVAAQAERAATLRAVDLPNALGPAASFDPRLPHRVYGAGQREVVFSDEPAPPLPDVPEDVAFAPLGWLSRWLRDGAISSRRLTEIYLERLERIGPALECVVTLTRDLALSQAEAADREIAAGAWRGPLHGVPWGAKDLLDTAGLPTTWGAAPYRERVAASDAAVVERLREAGAVLVAKTTLGALAYGDVWFGGRTRNPWNTGEGASGSSAGSGAAVAAGLVGFAIGTETMGSIVSPCMRSGATGLRPTFGRVSRRGAMALCWSLDKIGPMCRRVEDTAMVLAALNGHDPADPGSVDVPFGFDAGRGVEGLRVGHDPRWFEEDVADPLDRAALAAAEGCGAELVEVRLPDLPYDALWSILHAEAAAAFEPLTLSGEDDALVRQDKDAWPNLFRKAHLLSAVHLVQAERLRRRAMLEMDALFDDVDVLLGPSFAGKVQLVTNMTGHPSLTLRAGFVERPTRSAITAIGALGRVEPDPGEPLHRVPHGVTLWGRLYDEGTLLNLGTALERVLDVWHERPPV